MVFGNAKQFQSFLKEQSLLFSCMAAIEILLRALDIASRCEVTEVIKVIDMCRLQARE